MSWAPLKLKWVCCYIEFLHQNLVSYNCLEDLIQVIAGTVFAVAVCSLLKTIFNLSIAKLKQSWKNFIWTVTLISGDRVYRVLKVTVIVVSIRNFTCARLSSQSPHFYLHIFRPVRSRDPRVVELHWLLLQ